MPVGNSCRTGHAARAGGWAGFRARPPAGHLPADDDAAAAERRLQPVHRQPAPRDPPAVHADGRRRRRAFAQRPERPDLRARAEPGCGARADGQVVPEYAAPRQHEADVCACACVCVRGVCARTACEAAARGTYSRVRTRGMGAWALPSSRGTAAARPHSELSKRSRLALTTRTARGWRGRSSWSCSSRATSGWLSRSISAATPTRASRGRLAAGGRSAH
jgi:hypothetical protein